MGLSKVNTRPALSWHSSCENLRERSAPIRGFPDTDGAGYRVSDWWLESAWSTWIQEIAKGGFGMRLKATAAVILFIASLGLAGCATTEEPQPPQAVESPGETVHLKKV